MLPTEARIKSVGERADELKATVPSATTHRQRTPLNENSTMTHTDVPHPPSIAENAFNCPHCGAHADQTWLKLFAESLEPDQTPHIPDREFVDGIRKESVIDDEAKRHLIEWARNMDSGLVFTKKDERSYVYAAVYNLYISRCFSCGECAVWRHDQLIFPSKKFGIAPNPDLPREIKADYEEAQSIVDLSPRGAAALLRLCIQNLCVHLDQPGKHLDTDIAALVKAGLDVRVQQALDVVRVVGNNAVHPGQMDFKDDRDIATTLFGLVNLIAEKTISEPNHVNALFASLPEGAREHIDRRDKKS